MGKNRVIDQEKFLSFACGGDGEAERMAELFVQQAECYLNELRQSMVSTNPQEWHDVAHKFKGMAGFAGADFLYTACCDAQAGWEEPTGAKEKLFNAVEQETVKATLMFKHLYSGQEQ